MAIKPILPDLKAQAVSKVNRSPENLDAKLRQGHDPNMEHQNQGNLLGNLASGNQTQKEESKPGNTANNIENFITGRQATTPAAPEETKYPAQSAALPVTQVSPPDVNTVPKFAGFSGSNANELQSAHSGGSSNAINTPLASISSGGGQVRENISPHKNAETTSNAAIPAHSSSGGSTNSGAATVAANQQSHNTSITGGNNNSNTGILAGSGNGENSQIPTGVSGNASANTGGDNTSVNGNQPLPVNTGAETHPSSEDSSSTGSVIAGIGGNSSNTPSVPIYSHDVNSGTILLSTGGGTSVSTGSNAVDVITPTGTDIHAGGGDVSLIGDTTVSTGSGNKIQSTASGNTEVSTGISDNAISGSQSGSTGSIEVNTSVEGGNTSSNTSITSNLSSGTSTNVISDINTGTGNPTVNSGIISTGNGENTSSTNNITVNAGDSGNNNSQTVISSNVNIALNTGGANGDSQISGNTGVSVPDVGTGNNINVSTGISSGTQIPTSNDNISVGNGNNTSVTAGSSTGISSDGISVNTSSNVTVIPPALTVYQLNGQEDQPVAVNFALNAQTGADVSTAVVITGMPEGGILSAGTHNNDGNWTLTSGELAGLTFTPPVHWSGNLALSVTATTSIAGITASAQADLPITIAGIAVTPNLTVSIAAGMEDTAIPLTITTALVNVGTAEHLSVTIAGMPQGAALSAGTRNIDGTWTLTAEQLAGIAITPPAHWSGNFNLEVTATSTENGTNASVTTQLPVVVTGVAIAPAITAPPVTGSENIAVPLVIDIAHINTDMAETLEITISGVPESASLSTGIHNNDGSWTLTGQQLAGLTLTPPPHWSGEFTLAVTATTGDNNTTASSNAMLPIIIAGVAEAPALSTVPAIGNENSTIPLVITTGLADINASETLLVQVTGLPAGASLSAGTHNPDGNWTLTTEQLNGLTLTPPQHWSGSLELSVTATTNINGTNASTVATLPVIVTGIAEAASLNVIAASGVEDARIPLAITAALTDIDPVEMLSVTIHGVPSGARLSAGMHNTDGSWTLTTAQLSGLTLTPPSHWSGHIELDITATSSVNGTTATTSATLPVNIIGVAIAPVISVETAIGSENSTIALHINAGHVNNDPAETIGITISELPVGAQLSSGIQNTDGTWSLTSAQLDGLTLTPPQNWSGSIPLTVTATTNDAGTSANTIAMLPVTVTGVAIAPALAVQAATGNENTDIALHVDATHINMDSTESLSITISGVPEDASLSAGIHNNDGSWTLTGQQLAGLTLTPPPHWSGEFTLAVTAATGDNNTIASSTANIPVVIAGIAEIPALTALPVIGNENGAIPLAVTAGLADIDASETLSLQVTGLPQGATLSTGTHNSDGSWTLTAQQLAGLTLTPPQNWSGSFNATVTATTQAGETNASSTVTLPVVVAGIAEPPLLSAHAAIGVEDTSIPLAVTAALADIDASETLSVTITGLPNGAAFSAGTHNADGSWTLASEQLNGLTLTPPIHWSGNIDLSVTATSSAADTDTTANTVIHLPVNIIGVAVAPILSVQSASGSEDTPVALHIDTVHVNNDSLETLSVNISGIPAGGALSAGTHNADGSWTLTQEQLSGLTMNPPAHWSGELNLTVTSTTSENGVVASTAAMLPVIISGIAEAPALTAIPAIGNENGMIALAISAGLADINQAETLSVNISGLPNGASLSSGIHNSDGSWTLTSSQLQSLTFTPPAHWSGNLDLSVTATTSVNGTTASTVANLPVVVTGIAEAASLHVIAASGVEDTHIPLAITAALIDIDSMETLSVAITGMPAGASLSAGTHNTDGSWTLTSAQLQNLTLTPPPHWSGNIDLNVTATSAAGGTTATTSAILPVNVIGIAIAPSLSTVAAVGNEDSAIALHINTLHINNDTAETLDVTIAGLPSGASLSAGVNNADGTWSLTPGQLTGLTITPPSHWSGALNLSVTATAIDNGTAASTIAVLPVIVAGIAETPTLNVSSAIGSENAPVPLTIAASLADIDPAETLSINISGLPNGASLSSGAHNSDGSWTLTSSQLQGLTLTPPAHWSGNLNLSVTATTSVNGTSASIASTLPVTVVGVAEAPALTIIPAIGTEDMPITLSVNAALSDIDAAETLSVTLSGLPVGATLSAGTHNTDGSWTLTSAQLSGLILTPPLHWSGNMNLTVAAATSVNGTTANTTASLAVNVVGAAIAPSLSVAAASGNEDTSIALQVTAAHVNLDTAEALGVTISGVPTGATLSAGTHNSDGTWTLTTAQLSGLTLTPPTHFVGAFALTVTAGTNNNNSTASVAATLPVTIAGVAHTPALTVQAATGSEDSAIPIAINTALSAIHGSENLSLVISGVPDGSQLSAGLYAGSGKWSLAASDLTGLTITPPHNYSGTMALQVTAVATEQNDGNTAKLSVPLSVTVTPVADAPMLAANAVTGKEDTPIPLAIQAALIDSSENLSVTINNLPTGASLSAGTHNANGSWTLTQAQLTGLTLTPPAGSDTSFTLNVTASSTASNGLAASQSISLPVTVSGVAHMPTVTAGNVAGAANAQIPITIGGASTNPDGMENITYVVGGLPNGFALNHGLNNGDNSWTLTPSQLSGLTLVSPYNFQGTLALTATAVAHENNGDIAHSAALPFTASIGNASAGTQVNLASGVNTSLASINSGGLLSAAGVVILEDSSIPLSDAPQLLTLASGITALTFKGLPTGAALSAGTHNADGSWTLTPAQLTNLSLSGAHESDQDFNLTISATVQTSVTTLAGTVTTSSSLPLVTTPVHVIGVADLPALTVLDSTGNEGGSIALHIASALTDTDGSENLSIHLTGLPADFALNTGIHNADGSWSVSGDQLANLAVTPPAHWSGDAAFTVTATSTEREGASTSTVSVGHIHVNAVADAPAIAATSVSGTEDHPVALGLSVALADTGGSEYISSVTISGLPTGGTLIGASDNHDGTWSVVPAQLSAVQFLPPSHWSGDAQLSVTATSQELSNGAQASTTASLPLHIEAAPHAPVISALDSIGQSGMPIALHLSAVSSTSDVSEHLSAVISGLPDGAHLSAGLNNGDGSWTLKPAEVANVTLTPPSQFSGDIHLSLSVMSMEGNQAQTAASHQDFTVHVATVDTHASNYDLAFQNHQAG